MRAGPRRRSLVVAAALVVSAVALVLSVLALSRSSTTPTSSSSGWPTSGVYADGPTGRPHFLLALTNLGDGRVRGAIDFEFQDGQTSVVFSFRGTAQTTRAGASTGVLTLTPTIVPSDSSPQLLTPPPAALSATFGPLGVDLGECASFLRVSSLSACAFSLDAYSS